jgi:hypothetical protein
VTLPLIALVWRFSLFGTIVSIVISLTIQNTFSYLCDWVGYVNQMPTLALVEGHPLDNVLNLITGSEFHKLIEAIFFLPWHFTNTFFHAFHFAGIVALIGLFLLKDWRIRLTSILLTLPAILTFGLMDIAGSFYTKFPRLVYSAFPIVFLLNGFVLVKIMQWFCQLNLPRLGQVISGSWIAACFVVANIDVFGFPAIYYFWFYMTPGFDL